MFIKGCDMLSSHDLDGPELLPGLKVSDKTSVFAGYVSECPFSHVA